MQLTFDRVVSCFTCEFQTCEYPPTLIVSSPASIITHCLGVKVLASPPPCRVNRDWDQTEFPQKNNSAVTSERGQDVWNLLSPSKSYPACLVFKLPPLWQPPACHQWLIKDHVQIWVRFTAAKVDTEKLLNNSLLRYSSTFLLCPECVTLRLDSPLAAVRSWAPCRETTKKERKKRIRKDYIETSMLHST